MGVAMRRSCEKRLIDLIPSLLDYLSTYNAKVTIVGSHMRAIIPHSAESKSESTAADLLGYVLFREAKSGPLGGPNKDIALQPTYSSFDSGTGAYMAEPSHPLASRTMRVPASGDTPSAEVLALLAGVEAKTADLIRRNLMHQIEYDELPPGDILLGLSQGQK
jgi:hypothetical protein